MESRGAVLGDRPEVGRVPSGPERGAAGHPEVWAALLLAAALIVLTFSVLSGGWAVRADEWVRGWVLAHQTPTLHSLAQSIIHLLVPVFEVTALLVISAVIALWRRSWRPIVVALAALALLGITVLGLKHGLSRPPPPHPIGELEYGGAFPSGHAASLLICAGTLVLLRPRRARPLAAWLAVAGLTALIGASLIYGDYHWFSDVVGSVALGLVVLVLLSRLARPRPRVAAAAMPQPFGGTNRQSPAAGLAALAWLMVLIAGFGLLHDLGLTHPLSRVLELLPLAHLIL